MTTTIDLTRFPPHIQRQAEELLGLTSPVPHSIRQAKLNEQNVRRAQLDVRDDLLLELGGFLDSIGAIAIEPPDPQDNELMFDYRGVAFCLKLEA